MRVDECELFAGCHANATGLITNPVLTVVAGCDQHAHVTVVPPFAQHRAYEVPGAGEVTVMIGAPRPGSSGEGVSAFRIYLPDGTGTQGEEWPDYVGGDPGKPLSAWLLLSMVLPGVFGGNVPASLCSLAVTVAEYAAEQAERLQTEQQDYQAVLRKAAPVGTVVLVAPQAPGWVRLSVEIPSEHDGGDKDPVTRRVVNPIGEDHITARVGSLLGIEYSPERDAMRADAGVVGRLGLRLHGATGSLFAEWVGEYVVTFDPRPIAGPGAIEGLKRMTYSEASALVEYARPRVGRIVNAATLHVV